ncbi:MAG: hypothetical protein E7240_09685 [Lachnospiraceae bacterium]|nr:hypothetical protein [Lachnospiraceae bacterium]
MKIRKKRKKWILALLAIVLILLARAVPAGAAGKEPEPDGQEEKQLVITVVEDIPAEDLEENTVPLAASPAQRRNASVMRGVLIAVCAAAVLALWWYFMGYDRKLRRGIRRYEKERE